MNADDNFAGQNPVEKLLYQDESYAIRGAVFEVYRVLGSGFLEAVYQECLGIEFKRRQIPFKQQVDLPLVYKDQPLQQIYRADFISYEKIIIEIKASKDIGDEHRAQVFNYLQATNHRLGLLVNFGHYPKVTIERFIL